jgi:hypothetical protein
MDDARFGAADDSPAAAAVFFSFVSMESNALLPSDELEDEDPEELEFDASDDPDADDEIEAEDDDDEEAEFDLLRRDDCIFPSLTLRSSSPSIGSSGPPSETSSS